MPYDEAVLPEGEAVAGGETVRVFRRGMGVCGGEGAEVRERRGSGSGKGRCAHHKKRRNERKRMPGMHPMRRL